MTPRKTRRSAAVRLRGGRRGDLDALAALESEIFKSRLFAGHLISRASFRRLLALPSATFIVAEVEAQIGAYILLLYRINSGAARMYSIGVTAHFRRLGRNARGVKRAQHRPGSIDVIHAPAAIP